MVACIVTAAALICSVPTQQTKQVVLEMLQGCCHEHSLYMREAGCARQASAHPPPALKPACVQRRATLATRSLLRPSRAATS